jgi:nucleotide-binding universal stress UspA family protein
VNVLPIHNPRGTLVCGVDDSDAAVGVVRAAADLSARFDLRLVLVSIADGFVDGDGRAIESLTTSHAREGAKGLLRRLGEQHRLSIDVELRHDVGDPAEALARVAQEERADLLLIGAARPRLLRRGDGLAGELAAASPCPVVVVPRTRDH